MQPTDNMLRNLGCLAEVYGEVMNFGFMDYREGEKVFENYDIRLDYGKSTPCLIAFANGKAYPADSSALGAAKLSKFVENYQDNC